MKKFKEGDRVVAVKDKHWEWGNQDNGSVGTITNIDIPNCLSEFDYSVHWDSDSNKSRSCFYHEYNLKLKTKLFQEEFEV